MFEWIRTKEGSKKRESWDMWSEGRDKGRDRWVAREINPTEKQEGPRWQLRGLGAREFRSSYFFS
jgi:hypothetical protein